MDTRMGESTQVGPKVSSSYNEGPTRKPKTDWMSTMTLLYSLLACLCFSAFIAIVVLNLTSIAVVDLSVLTLERLPLGIAMVIPSLLLGLSIVFAALAKTTKEKPKVRQLEKTAEKASIASLKDADKVAALEAKIQSLGKIGSGGPG